MEAAKGVINTGLGLALERHNDRRQLRQQGKLNQQQIEAQQQMGRFNQSMALEMWEATNYSAQRKELEKAGLNAGLLYGISGGGGTTAQTQAGAVGAHDAPHGGQEVGMGLQLGLQAAMQKAQIQLAESQANKNNVEAAKIGGADTENVQAQTKNTRAQQAYTEVLTEIANIEVDTKNRTQQDIINTVHSKAEEAIGVAQQEKAKGQMMDEEYETYVQQLKLDTEAKTIQILATKAGIEKTKTETQAINTAIKKVIQETRQIITERQQSYEKLNQKDKEIQNQKIIAEAISKQVEFSTSTPQEIKQWTSIFTEVLKTVSGPTPTPNKIGF